MNEINDEKPEDVVEPVAQAEAPDPSETLRGELLYLRAEFENYKKRMLREQESSIRFANERLITDLSGIVDYFEMALSHSPPIDTGTDPGVKNFVAGIEMTYRELIQLLSKFGVEFIGSVGDAFDPQKYEAVSQMPTSEDSEEGKVVQVLQRGCALNGRLLKPAKVVVGQKTETEK